MATLAFQAFPYRAVADTLPADRKESIQQKVEHPRGHGSRVVVPQQNIGAEQKTSHCLPITVALGIIIFLGGIFLSLAAHQILPHGVNALSELGIWGEVVGYGSLGLGLIIILAGAVKQHLTEKQALHTETPKFNLSYDAEVAEMDAYFPQRLKANELFAVDDPDRHEIRLYYTAWDDDAKHHLAQPPEIIKYDRIPEISYLSWAAQHQDTVKDKTFITLDMLHVRTLEHVTKRQQSELNPLKTSDNKQHDFKLENLPRVGSVIEFADVDGADFTLKINKRTIISNSKSNNEFYSGSIRLGTITNTEESNRTLAYLLQKNKKLVVNLLPWADKDKNLEILVNTIRSEWPAGMIAGLCLVDVAHKQILTAVFGNAKLEEQREEGNLTFTLSAQDHPPSKFNDILYGFKDLPLVELRTPKDRAVVYLENLPAIKSTIQVGDLRIHLNEKALRPSTGNALFGAVTSDGESTRVLASLLQKNEKFLNALVSWKATQKDLDTLATAIRAEWPSGMCAALCVVDPNTKTFMVEIFGEAKIRAQTIDELYNDEVGLPGKKELVLYSNDEAKKIRKVRYVDIVRVRAEGQLPNNQMVVLKTRNDDDFSLIFNPWVD